MVSCNARDMAAAREIVRQHDIPRTEAPHGPVADLNLDLAGEGNKVLASRRGVPVQNLAGRAYAEHYTFSGLKLLVRDLYLLEVGLAVFAGVKSRDLHDEALVENLSSECNRVLLPNSSWKGKQKRRDG